MSELLLLLFALFLTAGVTVDSDGPVDGPDPEDDPTDAPDPADNPVLPTGPADDGEPGAEPVSL
ncbi:hypothetical protein [Tateyamaria sp. SN6-1]|uniref:hypothetical protein n=1 Tax=Tateyamaria sp. SN6-1 TaxID=3092148 RepID=UPI0039F58443